MHPICLDAFSPEQLSELDQLYHTSPDARVRSRALMILLSAERHLVAAEIAAIVRQHEETVRRWLVRYAAEGTAGLADAPPIWYVGSKTPGSRSGGCDCGMPRTAVICAGGHQGRSD
jgi:hypothetical protein